MENLKRYDIGEVDTGIGVFTEMVEEENGRFVRYEDVINLISKIKKYKEWYDDCQNKFLILSNENKRLISELEQKDEK